jgi:hypothetical protein
MFRGKGEGLRKTSCKVNLGKLSHQISMVSIGKEKRSRLTIGNEEIFPSS